MVKKINDWTIKRFLPLYDRNPLLGSMLGIACICFALIAASVFMLAVEEITGTPMLITALVMAPIFLILLKLMFMVLCLACELLWRNFGVYTFLKVQGCPMRDSYEPKD